MRRRVLRINDLLRQEISDILLRLLRDPRLGTLVSITEVRTSDDLQRAGVFVSVLGNEVDRTAAFAALRAASQFIRRELSSRLDLKTIPDLSFHYDDSIERGARVLAVLNEIGNEIGEEDASQDAQP